MTEIAICWSWFATFISISCAPDWSSGMGNGYGAGTGSTWGKQKRRLIDPGPVMEELRSPVRYEKFIREGVKESYRAAKEGNSREKVSSWEIEKLGTALSTGENPLPLGIALKSSH